MFGKITINSFGEIDSFQFEKINTKKIIEEIEGKSKEYILGVDENEYKNYLVESYSLTPLKVDLENETIDKPVLTKEEIVHRGRLIEIEVYDFTISYSFTGSPEVFRIKPPRWAMTAAEISVNGQSRTVSFSFRLHEKNPEKFKRAKDDISRRAFANLDNANDFVESWNNQLSDIILQTIKKQKKKFKEENDFFAAINVKVNKETQSVFSAPTVKKKIIPQPKVSGKKEFSSEPMMSKEMYDDVLKVIYDLGKSMEKKPSTYQNKDEEGLRDQILLVLETRYEGTTASGETFNRGGKTDIILKYAEDNSNLFVAECKFWNGTSEFNKAIFQLFDRYLTWRDSKTALILFVQNKDFSSVLDTIQTDIGKHPYFKRAKGKRGESSFSYIFGLPQDKDKEVFFEVIAFHYDK